MALLEVRDVGVRFHGLVALDGVSLSVSRGEVVGLIGPNGAGKTTLFNTVTGLQRADSGTVSFDGRDVTALSADRRARAGIGRTFQTPQLIERLSVYDNILLGCQARMGNGLFADGLRLPSSWRNEVLAHREVDDVVAELGLGEHVHRGVGELPLGVRRLVEIARALCTRPRLLLLDEAASGIGREESGQLAELFSRIRREHDLSMLVVEHDVDFVLSLCDYVYVLDFGRLIARGTPDLVRANPDVIAAYLGQGGTLAFGRAPAVKAAVGGVPPSGARQRADEEEGSAAAAAR